MDMNRATNLNSNNKHNETQLPNHFLPFYSRAIAKLKSITTALTVRIYMGISIILAALGGKH